MSIERKPIFSVWIDRTNPLRAATAEAPDLMILDLAMAPVDGFEVVERVRRTSQVPIIVLSVRESEQETAARRGKK